MAPLYPLLTHFCLQILFPVRGRKPYRKHHKCGIYILFANTIPRQGTETNLSLKSSIFISAFANTIPRQGTETQFLLFQCLLSLLLFANTIPCQGTETLHFQANHLPYQCLQILFPVRGRSPYTIFYFYLRRQKMNFVYFIFYHLIRELF